MSAEERWAIISNCQTYGWAHSLQLLAAGVTVTPVDVAEFKRDLKIHMAALPGYDRVLAGRSALDVLGADFARARRLHEIPELNFTAYHPDMTYVWNGATLLAGPLDVYHSAIAFAAHREGLTVETALTLFRRDVYAAGGYLDRWTGERDRIIAYCAGLGFDVSLAIRRWGRESAFMYSTNHPRICVLYDLARIFLEREGYPARVTDVLPQDALAGGGVFPVYPEVGDALGVPGSYLFKRAFAYRQIGLRDYVEECFAAYDAHPAGSLSAHPVFAEAFEKVAAVVGREAARA